MVKHTILFLAANPIGTDWLALDEEVRAIQLELDRSDYRDHFELVTRWATQPLDLMRALRKEKPTIVHFSGHGGRGELRSRREPRRDICAETEIAGGEQPSLFFHGPDRRPQGLSPAALREIFAVAGASVRLVVLNACDSDAHADAIAEHVDGVVGVAGSVSDEAAISFATSFYGALSDGEPVGAAYQQGRAAIALHEMRDGARSFLRARNAIDAARFPSAADIESATAAHDATPLQYLIYKSTLKLAMLSQQIAPQGSLLTLEDTVSHLRKRGAVGAIGAPREYFYGAIEMHWGPVGFERDGDPDDEAALRSTAGMILFQGDAPRGIHVALIGSRCHMTGDPGISPAQHVRYTNPSFWARIADQRTHPTESSDHNLRLLHEGLTEQQHVGPAVVVRFLAKTFLRRSGILIGSPLFVAIA